MNQWLAIGALGVVAMLIPLSMAAVSWLLRPRVPEQGKTAVYESGEVPTGTTRVRFNIQYYMIALLFVVFDVETVLIFPWTVIYRDAVSAAGATAVLWPMLLFIGVLVVGLGWAWRKGAVRWVRNPETGRGQVRSYE
ncbi:MAG: NADH-quinone oxidoreductase subunit A [Halobacteriaceae archaeon]